MNEIDINIARLKKDPPKKQPIKPRSIFPSYEWIKTRFSIDLLYDTIKYESDKSTEPALKYRIEAMPWYERFAIIKLLVAKQQVAESDKSTQESQNQWDTFF